MSDLHDQPTNASPEEVEERVSMVVALLLKGYAQQDIVNYLHSKTEWGAKLSKRHLRNYVYNAREELQRIATQDIDRREAFATAVTRLNWQYQKADSLNDVARAIQAVRELIGLLKLDQPQAALDWRSEAEKLGLNPSDLFNELLKQAADHAPAAKSE